MKHSARLTLFGGYGEPPIPPFSYDLFGPRMYKAAQKGGVIRLGEAPGAGEDDRRAMCLAYSTLSYLPWATKSNWGTLVGGSSATGALRESRSPFGGGAGIGFVKTNLTNPHAFAIVGALAPNEGFSFRAQVNQVDGDGEEAKGHVWGVRLGDPGHSDRAAFAFKVIDGKPEICRHAKTWTRADEDNFHQLLGIASPSEAQSAQIDTLAKSLYSARESLNFSRDQWRGSQFQISLIPQTQRADAQGNPILCVVLEGGSSLTIELEGGPGQLHSGGAIEVFSTGGAWNIQPMQVRFWGLGRANFGPIQNGYWAESLNSAQFASQFAGEAGTAVAWTNTEYSSVAFGFRATLTTSDPRYSPWLFALSARIPNDARSGLSITTPSFDTGNLYAPVGHTNPETRPFLNASFSMDEQGRRSVTINLRDIDGRVSGDKSIEDLVSHEGTLLVDGVAAITRGMVTRATWENLKKLAEHADAGPQQQGFRVAKKATQIALVLDDGNAILEERRCKDAPVGDGKILGHQIRDLLILAGYSLDECANIPLNLGPKIDAAQSGDGWANLPSPKDSIASAISALLDRYGDGLRFYRNRAGIWTLERVPTTVKAAYSSNRATGGRRTILKPLDWEIDQTNYFNSFLVRGKNIVRTFFDAISAKATKSIFGKNPKLWLGRKREYEDLEDEGLKSEASVNYALRSLRWRYGRPGRTACFETYFDLSLIVMDRITVDEVLFEVVSLDWDLASDRMQIRVREVV